MTPLTIRVEAGPASPRRWLSANGRGHWRTRQQLTRVWRWAGKAAALNQARGARLDRVHVVADLHFGDVRRRDPANYAPTLKAVLDGLVDAGLIPDDDWRHLDGPDARLGAVDPVAAAVTLTITDLGPARPTHPEETKP